MLRYTVRQLHFLDNTTEDLVEDGITVIVGPNNSGKSVLLGEISSLAQNGSIHSAKWLSHATIDRNGTTEDLTDWFNRVAKVVPSWQREQFGADFGIWDSSSGQQFYSLETAQNIWFSSMPLGSIAHHFVAHLDARSRSGISLGGAARDPLTSAVQPIHKLWDSRELEAHFSMMVRRAFGFDICINRYAQSLNLLVGKTTIPDEPLPPSNALMEQYARMPAVDEQGDGVRSFVGLLLATVVAGTSVTLIDEPEAFLHPPQARLIGKYLSEETPPGSQILIATHSADVLDGILDSKHRRPVKIIRVSTDPVTNSRRRTTLPADRVEKLWSDPLLRYSRLMNGLFHKGVIVCEADGDCRFYAAVLDVILNKEHEHDLFFTHVNGKARLHRAVEEMRSSGVRVAAIADIDILNDASTMKTIINAAEGQWSDFESDIRSLINENRGRSTVMTVGGLRQSTSEILRRGDGSQISDLEAKKLISNLKPKSGWAEAKRSGLAAFEGSSALTIRRVLEKLREIGIFVVPVGELERWFPQVIGNHGPGYVTAVLESAAHETPSPELRGFVNQLLAYFGVGSPEYL
ncbi:ATP-dependent endonuclease [Amycolatopsis sp. Poz14]|uniref:ATP-dependent nuclease n=1 Tax=Amycolatopsis sp. Poz14 TaxID=1447705 RepID=UPI001EE8E541|nr:AAA family ATPase [Amycolatopsis sp. Poz14]MCG3756328.1 ATP-binding protein [Amycolatopsis sp. Poz14]